MPRGDGEGGPGMPRRYRSAHWSMAIPEGWDLHEGEDGPMLSAAEAGVGLQVQVLRLHAGTSPPAPQADLATWQRFAAEVRWTCAAAALIRLGDLVGLCSTAGSEEAPVPSYLLVPPVPKQARALVLQVFGTGPGPRGAGGGRPRPHARHQVEQMLATIQSYPNWR